MDGEASDHRPNGWSRRRFLGMAAAVAGHAAWPKAIAPASPRTPASIGGPQRSRVVKVQSDYVVLGHTVHPSLLREMLDSGLMTLTGRNSAAAAWHRLLRPDDIVGIKFNRSGQEIIGTTPAVAEAIVMSLYEAGWPADRLVCIEAPDGVAERLGTRRPVLGFDAEAVDFGSGRDQLALVLRQVTALIDVPFVKTHNIAGMTCALKNLSHAFIKHPARYHHNGCSPYIADVVALPQIRGIVRLCIADGLRVAYAGGPDPSANTIEDSGILLLSTDLVSIDAIALGLLNDIRPGYNLGAIADNPRKLAYLAKASDRGLGVLASHGIDLVAKVH